MDSFLSQSRKNTIRVISPDATSILLGNAIAAWAGKNSISREILPLCFLFINFGSLKYLIPLIILTEEQ